MRGLWLRLLCCVGALCGWGEVSAQYYSWGADRPMKWSRISTPEVRMLYPDTLGRVAVRTLDYIQKARPYISAGFDHGPLPRVPFVMHPDNFESNGLVMYLPKRVEFLTIPSADNYSTLWLKQLVAHEYRHTVQYENLNQGVFRAFRWLFGQQSSIAGLLCMPPWAMEGDAVMSETAMSTYGRGLQPSFTLGFRALGEAVGRDHRGRRRKNIDRWFCGSFRDYIPDHYELGYQICSYAYTRYGENVWNRTARYGTRRPYVLATTRVALEKYYGTNVNRLFAETFADLNRLWSSLPEVEETSRTLTCLEEGNHTTYKWPLALDSVRVLAWKYDFDRPPRLVEIDRTTLRERTLAHTGRLSTRPVVDDGQRVWWTEYRPSKLFEERVNSVLCRMDLDGSKPRTVARHRNVLYPTASDKGLGWVEYRPDGIYTVVTDSPEGGKERWRIPFMTEVHGLAWDDLTVAWYVLVTSDRGMYIARIDSEGLHPITRAAHITLSDLRAGDGRLYFGSIASGKDEAHCYDLINRREYRLSESRYGSFSPAPLPQGGVVMTTYDRKGYRLTELDGSEQAPAVDYAPVPHNVVNPQRRIWAAVNLDTVSLTPRDSSELMTRHPARRYRRALGAVKIHSWMPAAFDPFMAVDEHKIDVNVGLTLLSQNLLSNTEAFACYGWNRDEGSLLKFGARYSGLGPRFALEASYGGHRQVYSLVSYDRERDTLMRQPLPGRKTYHSVGLSAQLPLYFQAGYHTRMLSLSAAWNYSNGAVARLEDVRWDDEGRVTNLESVGYREGLHKMSFGIGFSDQVRMAYRQIAPRWGYTLSASYALNPSNRDFSDLVSVFAQCYLPGLGRLHSLKLAANYQTSVGGFRMPSGRRPLSYRSSRLIPRGFSSADILSDNYRSFSADYQLPVWYPEGGIPSVIYLKRVRLSVGGDYACFGLPAGGERRLWSVGGDLIVDFNVLRQPASATSTFKLSVFRPSDGNVWVAASLGLPF